MEITEIENLVSQDHAECLIKYLTESPTPLREAVSYKLEDVIKKYPEFFNNELSKRKMINAISDINPNVSRVMCNIIENNDFLGCMLIEGIIEKLFSILSEIKIYEEKNKDFFKNELQNKKNHSKNKLLFALYWYLEALSRCNIKNYEYEILKILNFTIDFSDYTIREKTVKLLNKLPNCPVEILQKAKSDQNFYVKIQVYDKINHEDIN